MDGRREKALVAIFRTGAVIGPERAAAPCAGTTWEPGRHRGGEIPLSCRRSERYEGERMVKLYTSGSFLDPDEVPLSVEGSILNAFDGARRVYSSRAGQSSSPPSTGGIARPLRLAWAWRALRSYTDVQREEGVRHQTLPGGRGGGEETGFARQNLSVLKPPFLKSGAAIADTITSVRFAAPHSESISVNALERPEGNLGRGSVETGGLPSP